MQHLLVDEDSHLLDAFGVKFKFVLNLNGIDIFSVGKYDDLFLPASDVEKALLVEATKVTGIQPTIFQHLSSLLWPVVIAFHHIGPFGNDFPIPDFNCHHGQGLSGGADFHLSGTRESDHRSRLCHSKTFQDVKSNRIEKSTYLFVEGSSSGYHVFQMSAQSFVYLFEKGLAQTPAFGCIYQFQEGFCKQALVYLGHQSPVNQFVESWNSDKNGNGIIRKCFHQIGGLHGGRDDGSATGIKGDHHGTQQREDMVQRKQDEHLTFVVENFGINHRLHVGQKVGVGEHHPFGTAGGTRSIDDHGCGFVILRSRPTGFRLVVNGWMILEKNGFGMVFAF